MKRFKRFIYNRLFNERQRKTIWNAVLYSEYRHKRRGRVDAAANVRALINEIAEIAATKQRKFLESEVDEIVKSELKKAKISSKRKIEKAYSDGFVAGERKALLEVRQFILEESEKSDNSQPDGLFVKLYKADLEKCATCDKINDCAIKDMIDAINELKESKDSKESEDTPEKDSVETKCSDEDQQP